MIATASLEVMLVVFECLWIALEFLAVVELSVVIVAEASDHYLVLKYLMAMSLPSAHRYCRILWEHLPLLQGSHSCLCSCKPLSCNLSLAAKR